MAVFLFLLLVVWLGVLCLCDYVGATLDKGVLVDALDPTVLSPCLTVLLVPLAADFSSLLWCRPLLGRNEENWAKSLWAHNRVWRQSLERPRRTLCLLMARQVRKRLGRLWYKKAAARRSARRLSFFQKVQNALASTTESLANMSCQGNAGATPSTVKRSLGVADGGPFGFPTLRKQFMKGAELQVYYFEGMKGQGHVQDFSTAGQENLRREELNGRQKSFEFLPEYAALVRLSDAKNAAGSSQRSREKRRLFLESLPSEDRAFLQASEGLGNSQKAEVAWLEMNNYPYTKVEVDVDTWLSKTNPSESPMHSSPWSRYPFHQHVEFRWPLHHAHYRNMSPQWFWAHIFLLEL